MSKKPTYEELEKKVQELEQEIKICLPLLKILRLMCDEVSDMIWAKDTEKGLVIPMILTGILLINSARTLGCHHHEKRGPTAV